MIGIITAIDEEFTAVREALVDAEKFERAGMRFFTGRIAQTPVTLVRSGVGKVNAACCTQILIDVFGVEAVINVGVGGALAPGLQIGDLVISEDAMQYDMDASAFGHPRGEIPNMGVTYFPASKHLVETAERAARALGLRYSVGRVMTADLGLSDSALKKELAHHYAGLCCEMEGAAVGQAAFINGVAFLIIRSMSDTAEEDAGALYSQSVQNSADAGARLAVKVVEML